MKGGDLRYRNDEFPLLESIGLYTVDTDGNGNCLFHALSDQLYGNQSRHEELRLGTISQMRDDPDSYKPFLAVYNGGGVRRNPKRKNAGAFSSPANEAPPTPEQVDAAFEAHLKQMAKGGTYGDNMEIRAFSQKYGVDVTIYKPDCVYVMSSDHTAIGSRPVVHIAHHVFEHFSSIRNIDGPHAPSLPHVSPKTLTATAQCQNEEKLANAPRVQPWMVETVMNSLPYLKVDREMVRRTIEECKGSVDAAVSKLMDADERGSNTPSTQGSSGSIERDVDSADEDDELAAGRKKRQDRRLSRATRHAEMARRHNGLDRKQLSIRSRAVPDESYVPPTSDNNSIPSVMSGPETPGFKDTKEYSPPRTRNRHRLAISRVLADTDDEEDTQSTGTLQSASVSPIPISTVNVRLRLSQPRPEVNGRPASTPPSISSVKVATSSSSLITTIAGSAPAYSSTPSTPPSTRALPPTYRGIAASRSIPRKPSTTNSPTSAPSRNTKLFHPATTLPTQTSLSQPQFQTPTRLTAAQRRERKKADQKAAAKTRRQAKAMGKRLDADGNLIPLASGGMGKVGKENSPSGLSEGSGKGGMGGFGGGVVGMKTLYI
ncbi:hypothetical protein MMC25_005650 [Agyrium rufum]|nr:hypothetical protein [Agyrium rufum]